MTLLAGLPEGLQAMFAAAGWHLGRRVAVQGHIPAAHPAAAMLAEFGGLRVGEVGRGEECGRSDVAFGCEEAASPCTAETWSEWLGSPLVYVAATHGSHGELDIDGAGRYYENGASAIDLAFLGRSFREAMERLLLGRRSRPMLAPGQDKVQIYGEVVTADHPSVHCWAREP